MGKMVIEQDLLEEAMGHEGAGHGGSIVTSMITIIVMAGKEMEIVVDTATERVKARRGESQVRMRMRRCRSIHRRGRSRARIGS